MNVLVDIKYKGRVSILTKSPLLLRDIDLLKQLENVEVGVTITTDDDKIGLIYEAHAPSNSSRIEMLQSLSNESIPCYAFVGPIMTHYLDSPHILDRLLSKISSSGVTFIYAELLNISPILMQRLQSNISGSDKEVQDFISLQKNISRRKLLKNLFEKLAKKHSLHLRLGRVLDHANDRKLKINN